jgi:hypothetical protein
MFIVNWELLVMSLGECRQMWVSRTSFASEIRTKYLPNPNQICYLVAQLIAWVPVEGYGQIWRMRDSDLNTHHLAGAGNFSLHHRVQNGSRAHSASYPVGTGALFLGVKRQGREADYSPPSSAEVKEWVEL